MGTPQPPSKFWQSPPVPDDPVQQDAAYEFNSDDRAYIDSQILALQRQVRTIYDRPAPTPGQWTTVIDLDFRSLPNQTFASDGAVSFGGLNAVKYNTSQDLLPMAIVAGTGLQVTPQYGQSDISKPQSLYDTADPGSFASHRTAPILSIPLLQLLPKLDAFTPVRLRVWLDISYVNFIDASTQLMGQFGFENITAARWSLGSPSGMQYNLRRGANGFGQCWEAEALTSGNQEGLTQGDLLDYPNDVGLIACPGGLYLSTVQGLTGLYAGGFPDVGAMMPLFACVGGSLSSGSGNISRVDGIGSWAMYFAGINLETNATAASDFQGTITYKRVLLETQ